MITEQIAAGPDAKPRFNDYLGIPVHAALKVEIRALARSEERDMTSMARLLLKEAIAVRRLRSHRPDPEDRESPARGMAIAQAVAGGYLSAYPHGESIEDRIAGLARFIDAELRRFETPEPVGDEGTPQSVLVAASERFLDRDGYELFADLLEGTFDVKARAHSAADALRDELSEYCRRGNDVPTPQ